MDNKRLKILIVEDDEDDYVMTRDLLGLIKGVSYNLEWVDNFDDALDTITGNKHDIYLFDYRLGEKTGLDLLKEIGGKNCTTPVILLTGQGDLEIDMQAMEAGALDYLTKSELSASALERSIRYAMERKRTEERILQMAYYDSLTSLPNRALFNDRLRQTLAGNDRKKCLSAVLFLDLDNFKRVNDTLGHTMGDELLQAVSDRLMESMRKSDSVSRSNDNDVCARVGGDEFIILLSEIKHFEDASKVAARLIDALYQPFMLDSHEIVISVSIGIAIYPNDGEDVDTLLKNADIAMYEAKARGKNTCQYYKESMNSRALEKLTLESDLRKALENDELVLYYQPQLDLKTDRLIGLEALIRWIHPDKGMIPPLEFIYIAEQTGLINIISDWVLKTACRQSMIWQSKGLSPVPVSVNLSSHQFQQKDFACSLTKLLHTTGLNPEYLKLEITEGTLMQNTEATVVTLHQISKMGLSIILDDFGTGYSSLSYLKRFPIYEIKIDRSFVKNIVTSKDDTAIVKAIISMAHELNIKVLAEGVETEQQLNFLRDYNCDDMQGFLLSKPLPADEIEAFLTGKPIQFQITSIA